MSGSGGLRLVLATTLALAVFLGGALAYEAAHLGRVYPGVRVGSVDLSNLSQPAAAQHLQAAFDTTAARPLRIRYADRVWTTTLAQLGLRYDLSQTLVAAYDIGRTDNPFLRLGTQWLAPLVTPPLVPHYRVDEAALSAVVQQLAAAIDRPARDAGVRLDGTKLTVTATQEGDQLDTSDASAQLHARIAQLSAAPVTLKVTTLAPATGNQDVADAVAQAGRWTAHDLRLDGPTGTRRLTREQISALVRLKQPAGNGPMQATLDLAALRALLRPLVAAIAQAPRPSTFAIKHGALVIAQTGTVGRALDLDATVQTVATAIEGGQDSVLLPVRIDRPDLLTLDDAAAAQQQVALLAGKPLLLQAAGQNWTVAPRDLSAWLQMGSQQPAGHVQLTVTLHTEQVAALVAQIAQQVDQPATNARFAWKHGALQLSVPAQNGRQLDQTAATKAVLAALRSTRRTVALPLVVTKPAIDGQHPAQLGIKELVAQGTSNFAGSPPERIQNIARGAQLIDGSIIAPGAVFSFDDTVGDISTRNGFTTGLVILDHETKNGIGGGICQDSTTLFRAAFYAGLPIVERHDHSYAVPYYTQGGYPEGFDATIYSPELDLKVKNDTPHALLIQTSLDLATNTMTVSLYGTKINRVVKLIPGPITNRAPHPPDLYKPDPSLPKGVIKQVDWAHDGFDVAITRTISVAGKVIETDVFKSHAEPWQAIYLVGSGPAVK